VRVAHVPLDFSLGDQGRHRVYDEHIDSAAPDEHFRYLQSLLAGIGLGNQQVVGPYAELPGIPDVQGVLGIDESCDASQLLGLRHDVQGQGGLAGRFGAEDLDDTPPGHPTHTKCHVQGNGACRDCGHIRQRLIISQTHDGAFAELLFDLAYREINRLFSFQHEYRLLSPCLRVPPRHVPERQRIRNSTIYVGFSSLSCRLRHKTASAAMAAFHPSLFTLLNVRL